jgi:hypothetical protein
LPYNPLLNLPIKGGRAFSEEGIEQ